MDIDILILTLQFFIVIVTVVYVILVYKTLKSTQNLNQRILFNEIVKQERELRVKLNEYREEIHKRIKKGEKRDEWTEITFDYDTLIFNYYEYLGICIYQKIIDEDLAKKYFKQLLISVKEKFDYSILFEEGLAERKDYPGIQWLFKKFNIE